MRVVSVALLAGCNAASPDPGLGALVQVEGAQFRAGPFPADDGGPVALAVTSRHSEITIGELGEPLRGVLESEARGAVIGIDGAEGAWIVPAGVPDLDTPGLATVKATFGVADEFPPGPFTLLVAASDEHGRFGANAATMIVANDAPPPMGELVIGLYWDSAADLDLHVVDALGGEAWSDDPNTWQPPPPGEPVDPTAYLTGGILDHDGNKECRREGRPNEHVIWSMPPPSGEYLVRVDARSMCGDASAGWYVAAYRSGELIGAARGVATDNDVLAQHGQGAGVLALRFSLP
jgi:hypothetical protein